MADRDIWIGIQFNWIKKISIKNALLKFKHLGISSDGEHMEITLSKKELKKLPKEKINLIKKVIRIHLSNSEYTNIYTYLDAGKIDFLQKDNAGNPIELEEYIEGIETSKVTDKNIFFNNFKDDNIADEIKNIIRKNAIMSLMNELFGFVVKRDFAKEQLLNLRVELINNQHDDSWEEGHNNQVGISIQLELKEDTNI